MRPIPAAVVNSSVRRFIRMCIGTPQSWRGRGSLKSERGFLFQPLRTSEEVWSEAALIESVIRPGNPQVVRSADGAEACEGPPRPRFRIGRGIAGNPADARQVKLADAVPLMPLTGLPLSEPT
jgi:hypothetical protein